MARRSSAMPGTGVYLLKCWSIAACAATLIDSGVAKSGSPAPKSMTSTPSRRSRSTVAVTFIVGELEIRAVRSARRVMGRPCSSIFGTQSSDLFPEALLDHVGHEAVHAATQGKHLFD